MPEPMATNAELRSVFDVYMRVNFAERNLGQVCAMLEEETTCFGTGADEIAMEPGDMVALLKRDMRDAPNPVHTTFHVLKVLPIGPDVGLVAAVFDLSTEINGQPLVMDDVRMSLVFRRSEGYWRVLHEHLSMPTRQHEAGESYPLKELQRRNQWLEETVAAKPESWLKETLRWK